MATTRLGLGGPGKAYATFAAKAEAAAPAVPASRITRIALGGPGAYYGDFTDKAESDPSTLALFNYPIYCRSKKRR